MVYEKKKSENNAVCGLAFRIDENANIMFGSGAFDRFSTSNFVTEVVTFDDNGKAIARENMFILSRSGSQFNIDIRAYEPVPIDDDQTSNIQQALPFESTNTVIRQVVSKKYLDDIQDEAIRLENEKLDIATYDLEKQGYGASSTGDDDYQVSIPEITSYNNFQTYKISADVANVSSATLEINSLGAKTLKKLKDGAFENLVSDDIIANQIFWATYNLNEDCFQFSVDPASPTIAQDVENTKSIFTAGENMNSGDAFRKGDDNAVIPTEQLTSNTSRSLGQYAGNYEYGQSFIATGSNINEFSVWLYKTGSPSTTWNMEIFSDEALTSLITTSTNSISAASLTTDGNGEKVIFSFGTTTLIEGNTYYMKLNLTTGTINSSSYVNIRRYSVSGYLGGNDYSVRDTGTPTQYTGDAKFEFLFEKNEDITKSYKTNADLSFSINFIGFVNEDVTTGNTFNGNTAGIDSNQTGLTIGKKYYLSDISGEISTTPGTNSKFIGKAISETEIEIQTNGNNNLDGENSTSATTGPVVLGNAEGYITIKVNGVDKKIAYWGV